MPSLKKTVTNYFSTWETNTKSAFYYAFQSPKNIALTVTNAVIFFVLLVIAIFPAFFFELVQSDLAYITFGLTSLLELEIATHGWIGILLLLSYAILGGITTTVIIGQFTLRRNTRSSSSILGFLPGFIAAGCASCGAGVLGLLGYFGVVTLLPFGGLGVRFLAILLLILILGRIGNPKMCSFN